MKNSVHLPLASVLRCPLWLGPWLLASQFVAGAEPPPASDSEPSTQETMLSDAFRTAAIRASPGIVTVYTLRGPRMTPLWRERIANRSAGFARPNGRHPHHSDLSGDGQASGIIIDDNGTILTCNHVIASADALFVILPDGRRFEPVEVIGDAVADLALIRIDNLGDGHKVTLGNSDNVQVGDWVVSLGNPYELKHTVSAGIVSATGRRIPGIPHPVLQNDAATNPGSSGGALLNLRGEVIGVISGGFGANERFQGIGMAIPINVAKQFVADAKKTNREKPVHLGLDTQPLSPITANHLGLPIAGGLYVKDVEKGAPASIAGLREGDVITHFDDVPIDSKFRSKQIFEDPIPGDKITFTVFRNGKVDEKEVVLRHPPTSGHKVELSARDTSIRSSAYFDNFLGLGLDTLTHQLAWQLEYPPGKNGVLVTDVALGSIAYKEGIAAGMLVLRMNDNAIRSVSEFKKAMESRPVDKPLLLLVQSHKGKHLVVVEPMETKARSYLPNR